MTVAAVLAAGAGSRFRGGPGSHKLLAPWRDGRPVLWWAVRAALDAGIGPVVVVAGSVDVTAAVPDGAHVVGNPRWADGQATSLQVAVSWAEAAGATGLVVGLGDQPMVEAAAWRAVAGAAAPVAVATYGGRRGNPVRLAAEVWPLLPTEGDAGARVLIAGRPDLVGEVGCSGNPADIDTVEDLTAWSWPTTSG
ncbi:MAG TPA: NTP transferase domain-containing protein [Acidimicrobiales bacterium]|nr:NTP transferase domain-containing protein [Acidimicrobiales bacterium]